MNNVLITLYKGYGIYCNSYNGSFTVYPKLYNSENYECLTTFQQAQNKIDEYVKNNKIKTNVEIELHPDDIKEERVVYKIIGHTINNNKDIYLIEESTGFKTQYLREHLNRFIVKQDVNDKYFNEIIELNKKLSEYKELIRIEKERVMKNILYVWI